MLMPRRYAGRHSGWGTLGARYAADRAIRAMTGVPCPFCGMTRGVTDAVHGDFGGAAFLNPGSLFLVLSAVVLLVAWRRRTATFPAWLPYALVAALWGFQLFKYATGRPL